MARLLIVHHSPMASVRRLTDAVVSGATHPDLDGAVEAVRRPALEATADDVLASDGVICVTPVNFGYISGALKHFFDSSFRALEDVTANLPYAAVVKGTTDADGAVRALEAIATGMRWRRVLPPLVLEGPVDDDAVTATIELAATVAATIA